MAKDEHNRDVNEKLPGEKPEGTHHFNPGNQSGKSESPHVDKPTPEEKQEQK